MNFYLNYLVLWLNDGEKRLIEFKPNKVNVITGRSNTGKTAILEIFDYCMFASDHKISQSILNENVAWYGLNFHINDKEFTLARESPKGKRVSDKYFFSSVGDIPEFPESNDVEKSIKSILDVEFSIDRDSKFTFGGRNIKANSKISLRYFLMFNTISQNIITNSEVFFDKQNIDRYREALPRIFDLSVGVDTVTNILAKENYEKLSNELRVTEKKLERSLLNKNDYQDELDELNRKAKELGLVSSDCTSDLLADQLDLAINNFGSSVYNNVNLSKVDFINNKITNLEKKIANLDRFSSQYKTYKGGFKNVEDYIKPIQYISQVKHSIIKTGIFDKIVSSLEEDLKAIKKVNKVRSPIEGQITNYKKKYKSEIKELRKDLDSLPKKVDGFKSEGHKMLFLGEARAKVHYYTSGPKSVSIDYDSKIKELEESLEEIIVEDVSENRSIFIKLVEEIIVGYIQLVSFSMENYGDYLPVFNYADKTLHLRKPKTDMVENVGSSSNHMFMHLFLFLALHEVILRKNVPYIPSFLVVDQPSRPYYGDENPDEKKLSNSDTAKIKDAFKLFDEFTGLVKNDLNKQFQIIVFEHIPPSVWSNMDNVHLVEIFRDGNALIPEKYLNNSNL